MEWLSPGHLLDEGELDGSLPSTGLETLVTFSASLNLAAVSRTPLLWGALLVIISLGTLLASFSCLSFSSKVGGIEVRYSSPSRFFWGYPPRFSC